MGLKKQVDVDKIKRLRKSQKITIGEMSERLGYASPTGYAHLERGNARFPAAMLWEVADSLGVPMEELFIDLTKDRQNHKRFCEDSDCVYQW